ncbi:DUF2510 domain-containing protein [Arthrobacter sp. FW305-123]|nr:DUF2510 domain-containing protein [Arthrobacter sp. FW305-123]
MLTWNLEVRTYTTASGTTTLAPASMLNLGYVLVWSGLLLTYFATVVLAVLDTRRLLTLGVIRPFHWAWSFLGGVPYVIGRAVVLHKVAPRRGLWPLIVILVGWGIYYVAGSIKTVAFMQAVFSELGYTT